MKARIRGIRFTVGQRRVAIALFCGERWYRLSSWRNYPLFRKFKKTPGFHIGPIMFWDGS